MKYLLILTLVTVLSVAADACYCAPEWNDDLDLAESLARRGMAASFRL